MNSSNLSQSIVFILLLGMFFGQSEAANNYVIEQALYDGVAGVDGLDNPRHVKISSDNQYAWVTSSDDNALLIISLDRHLSPIKIFKNANSESAFKLEGANGLALFNNGQNALVSSFYDSAISVFKKDEDLSFGHVESVSDNLDYERVFKSNESLKEEDKLGILGAWGIATSTDEKQLFVASYKSNAISVFNIEHGPKLTFNNKYSSNGLGKPVHLAFAEKNNVLIVAGYEGNNLSVFSITEKRKPTLKQIIANSSNTQGLLLNPQYVIVSEDNKFAYVACSGSHSVLVFERHRDKYVFLQAITHLDTGGSGLTGVASLALSNDGKQLYAAGEFDTGILQFNVSSDGRLEYDKKIQTLTNEIEGVTSIAIPNSGNFMLVTLGKKDALFKIGM